MDNHDDEPQVAPPDRDTAASDPPTLAGLYRAHADLVWRTLVRMGVAESEVEDLVHEVFLVARRLLPDYDATRGAPSSWLYGLARGVAANWRRGRSRASRRLALVEPPEADVPVDRDLDRTRAVALVERFVATLEPDQREAFVLCDIEGMRGPEAAAALGHTSNQVYSRLRLARRHLAEFLAAHGIVVPRPEVG